MAEIRAAAHAAARAMVTLLLPRHDLQRRVHAAQEALQREFSEAEAEAAAANERLTAMEMHSKAVALEELAADRSGEEAARRATDLALEAETASEKAKLAEQEAERMEAAAEAAEQKLAEQTEGACVYGFCVSLFTCHHKRESSEFNVYGTVSPLGPVALLAHRRAAALDVRQHHVRRVGCQAPQRRGGHVLSPPARGVLHKRAGRAHHRRIDQRRARRLVGGLYLGLSRHLGRRGWWRGRPSEHVRHGLAHRAGGAAGPPVHEERVARRRVGGRRGRGGGGRTGTDHRT